MNSVVGLGFDRFGNHPLQQDLKGHGMGAAVMRHEKLTVTVVYAVFEIYMMVIIIAVKCEIKFIEEEAILLFSIPFCLFPFADHSVVHL